ncbi:MAG: family 10 glycosylhydrolase [Ruminococcaceae bacterium]|nr:family 10 glycosylhydrolase [Oscillospiraceae bacterium]
MRRKITAALALSICVLAGCSTETQPESSVNIIDIGSVSSSSSSYQFTATVPNPLMSSSVISASSSTSASVNSSAETPKSSSESEIVFPIESSQPVSTDEFSYPQTEIQPPLPPASEVHISEPPISETQSSSATTTTTTTTTSTATISSSTETTSSSVESSSSASSSEPKPVEPGYNSYQALNYGEVKGMWISYLDIMEMSSGTESAFRSEIAAAYDNCAALGINTVYVHVRSHGDAYYYSDYFPRTKYLSGSYDPLPIMIEEAHKRNLSFQAWINPLRMSAAKDLSLGNGYAVYNWADTEKLVKVGSYYYLNPAYSDVIDVIVKGVAEIVANYNVDGLHIDDYFYPTTDAYFDSEAFYDSGYSYISDFRRANCDELVSSLYSAVKTANPSALFGVSCQGNMDNNYNEMYADVEKWCRNSGYLDYIMPQIYFGFDNSTQPFAQCVKNWDNLAKGNVPLIVGLTAAKIGAEDAWAGAGRNEWITDSAILRRQALTSMEQVSYGGVCLFRYRLLFAPDENVTQIENEVSDLRSVIKAT